MPHISDNALNKRRSWVEEIRGLRGTFAENCDTLEARIRREVSGEGNAALRDHLRLCPVIPESYAHDSSEEKLYSKYTDIVVGHAAESLGMKFDVLTERSDAADVECWSGDFDFVADAKAFRLSRTAINAKDLKIQAMHGWKRGRVYALVVCPLYRLPSRESQIYLEATNRNVCVFSYSHLSLLTALADHSSPDTARALLFEVFKTVAALNQSKDSLAYWQAINRSMIAFNPAIRDLWIEEKVATSEALAHSKEEALQFYSNERRRILSMNHKEAISELLSCNKIVAKEKWIKEISDNGLMGIV